MLGRNPSEPSLFQMVDVESLVPQDHQLRKVDAVLDLSFVPEVVAECYAANRGRPSIDPELALRMMLLGVLYDLSDRELCEEIQMHAGMRWFLGLNFHDPVPDHSTLSRLRCERWSESGLLERLMDEVIRQCSEVGLVSGRHLSVDGTEVQANASVKSLTRRGPRGRDDRDPPQSSGDGTAEPKPTGEWKGRGERYTNETHFSPTDPDARLYRKGNQRGARLSYLVHDLIDTKSRVILRRRASRATGSAERDTALEMLDEVLESQGELGLPKPPEILTGDAGYGATELITKLLDRNIEPQLVTAVAYNARAAAELRERTAGLGASIRTIHSLALMICNLEERREVITERDQRAILDRLVNVGRVPNSDPFQPWLEALAEVRLALRDPDEVEAARGDVDGFADTFERYRTELARRRVIDFDEQIYHALELLLTRPDLRERVQRMATHLLVDEFQDLTPAFLLLIRLAAAPSMQLFAVGDDDQTIYSYAGASPDYLVDFDRFFPGAAHPALEVNYRCPPEVVEAAVSLLSHNRRRVEKTIRSGRAVAQ